MNQVVNKLFDTKSESTWKASQELAVQIENAIVSGKIIPGDKLPSERSLLAVFGCSRSTVREALRAIEEIGLIKIVAGVGAIVSAPRPKQLSKPLELILKMKEISPRELVEVRNVVELSIVEWASDRRTIEDLKAIERVLAQEQKHMSEWDVVYVEDRNFHETLAVAAKNRLSQVLMGVLRDSMISAQKRAFDRLSDDEKCVEQCELLEHHFGLYNAIKEHDAQTARRLMIEHIEQFEKLVSKN